MAIATGPFQIPVAPLPIGGKALHLHSSRYRNPQLLPPGAVLVIGSGNSGAQIAEELCSAGRRVFLSVSKHRRIPRRYRDKDYTWWYMALGEGDTTIDQQREEPPPRLLTGVGGGHDLDLRRLAADGVMLLGRVLGGRDGQLTIGTTSVRTWRAATHPLWSSRVRRTNMPPGAGWTSHLLKRALKSCATRQRSPILF